MDVRTVAARMMRAVLVAAAIAAPAGVANPGAQTTSRASGSGGNEAIVPFRIHPQTGKLQPTRQVTHTPTPVCIAFGPVVP